MSGFPIRSNEVVSVGSSIAETSARSWVSTHPTNASWLVEVSSHPGIFF